MLKRLTKNLGLKILACLVGFATWLIVINYADPVSKLEYKDVEVTIQNAESLTNKGKVYEILNRSNVIDVEIYAKRSVLESLSYENIRAVANLEDITIMDTVAIEVYSNKNSEQLDSIVASKNVVELQVEDRKEIPLTVNVLTSGEPADGYIRGDVTQNQNTVRVSGPESVVNRITRAACTVSISGRTSDLSTSADIRLYDTDGRPVTNENLKTNISTINVGVEILPTKAVDIKYTVSGEPAEGYTVVGEPIADRTAVYIAGRSSVLNAVDAIDVSYGELNIEGVTETVYREVDLSEYLPEGVRLVTEEDGFMGIVNVTINIEKLVTKSFNIPIRNLVVTNVPEGYQAEVFLNAASNVEGEMESRQNTLRIRAQGVEESFTDVTAATILGTLDVQAFAERNNLNRVGEGTFQMEIAFELPEGLELTEKYYADVRLTAETEGEEETN